MLNPALVRQLTLASVCVIAVVIALLAGSNIGSSNYAQLLLVGIVSAGVFITFFLGRFFWVLAIASAFLGGTFPILGGQFTPFQIMIAIGVVKFLIEDVVLRRVPIRLGRRFDFWMIAGFMGVMTFHGIHDRFGMKFLGSNIWGGRNYVNVFVGLAAFIVTQSIPLKPKMWAKLPYVVLGVITFDLVIGIVTTIWPSSIFKIYPFYSAVSAVGVEEIVSGGSLTGRVGTVGNFGYVLTLLVLASISVREVLHPSNFLRLLALATGALAVLYSGFRTVVLNTLLGTLAAGFRDLKGRVILLLLPVALFLFGLSIINSEFIRLPKQIQRSLVFLPGHWDSEMVRDATASNDFRGRVWTIFARQYFPVHPLLGRGFGFRSEWTQTSIYNPRGVDFQQMVETGNIHNGFLASLDALGVVGTFFFIVWCLRLLGQTFRVPARRKDAPSTALRFLALYLAVSIVSYWMGANTIGSFLPQVFAMAGVFLRLQKDAESEPKPTVASESTLVGAGNKQLAIK